MPYIKSDDGRREALRKGEPALSAGELNYQIFYYAKNSPATITFVESKEIIKCLVEKFLGAKRNYQKYNDMTGALIRCAKEVKRRLGDFIIVQSLIDIMESYDAEINLYEDVKIQENGDVE